MASLEISIDPTSAKRSSSEIKEAILSIAHSSQEMNATMSAAFKSLTDNLQLLGQQQQAVTQATTQYATAQQQAIASAQEELAIARAKIGIQAEVKGGLLSLIDAQKNYLRIETEVRTGDAALAMQLATTTAELEKQEKASLAAANAIEKQAAADARLAAGQEKTSKSAQEEIILLQQRIAIQKSAIAGTLELADASRKIVEVGLLQKGVNQEEAKALAALRQEYKQYIREMLAMEKAAAQTIAPLKALKDLQSRQETAQVKGFAHLSDLQQQITLQEQVKAGVLSLAEAEKTLAERHILAATGSRELASATVDAEQKLASLRKENIESARATEQQAKAAAALAVATERAAAAQARRKEATDTTTQAAGWKRLAEAVEKSAAAEERARKAREDAVTSAQAELATLKQRISLQEQVARGTITAAEAERRLGESAIFARTGNRELARELSAARMQVQQQDRVMREASQSARAFGVSLSSLRNLLLGLGAGILVMQGIRKAFEDVKSSISAAGAYETNRIALASLLQGTTQLVDESGKVADAQSSWAQNLTTAAELQTKIAQISAETLGTDTELLDVLRTALSFSRGQVATLDEMLKLSQGITNAGKLQGLEQTRLEDETRQILTLETNRGQTLLNLLGLSIQQAREYKQHGTLVRELNERLAAYNVLAKAAATSWQGLTTSVQTFARLFTVEAFSGVFDAIKQIAIGMAEELNKLQAKGGIASAIGADDKQLQNFGKVLADGFALLQVTLASITNALITTVTLFSESADAAEGFHATLEDLTNFLQNDVQIAIADMLGGIKDFIETMSNPVLGPIIAAVFSGLTGAVTAFTVALVTANLTLGLTLLPVYAIAAALGGLALWFGIKTLVPMDTFTKKLGDVSEKLEATAAVNKKFNADFIAGFAELAKAQERGFAIPEIVEPKPMFEALTKEMQKPIFDAIIKKMQEAVDAEAKLNDESIRIIKTFGNVTDATAPPIEVFARFITLADKLGVKFTALSGVLTRMPGEMGAISEAMRKVFDEIDQGAAKVVGDPEKALGESLGRIDLIMDGFKKAKDAELALARERMELPAVTRKNTLQELEAYLAALEKLRILNDTIDAEQSPEKLKAMLRIENERLTVGVELARVRQESSQTSDEKEASRVRSRIALLEQELKGLDTLVGKDQERQQKQEEIGELEQQLGPIRARIIQSRITETQEQIKAYEGVIARMREMQSVQDASARRATSQGNAGQAMLFQSLSAEMETAIQKMIVKTEDARNALIGLQTDVTANASEAIVTQMEGQQRLRDQQVAFAQEDFEREERKIQLALESAQVRTNEELQGIQARADANQTQMGMEEAILDLRRAQGASIEELASRERNLIALKVQGAQIAVGEARVNLASLRLQLDAQNKLIEATRRRFEAAPTGSADAERITRELEVSSLKAKDLETNVKAAEGALANAGEAAARAGVEGATGLAKINHELELTRAVLTSNDLREGFRRAFNAGSLKEAGKILQEEARNIGKRTWEALLFGKKDQFDEPLIGNVNGLFGVGDGGILGKIMQLGGAQQGKVWGNAVSNQSQQTLQQQLPQAANQALSGAQQVFVEKGQTSGAVFGDNCLSGFEQSFGDGIGRLLDSIIGGLVGIFQQGGSDMFSSFAQGFKASGSGAGGGGGWMDMFSGLFGGGGGGMGGGGGGWMDMFGGLFGGGGGMGGGGGPVGGWQAAGTGTYGGIPSGGSSAVTNGGAGFGGGASSGFSYIGIATALADIGKNFSDGNYGAGSGGAVGGILGAYFGMGDPQMIALGAQLGAMIGGIFDQLFSKQGRIDKEKEKILKYFEKIFDIDFDKLKESKVAKGIATFREESPGALALGALFAKNSDDARLQGTAIRFAGQFLGNLRKVGETSDQTRAKILELADAMDFDIGDALSDINAFTRASGENALTLGNFQEEIGEARKNLAEYGDTTNMTAKQLADLALAHGNTGSVIVTYGDLLTGVVDIHSEFNAVAASTVGVNTLLAKNFLEVAEAQGLAGQATEALAAKVRDGTLSLEEAVIAYNELRAAAGLANLALKDFTLDPEQLRRFADFLKGLTITTKGFTEGIEDALQKGLEGSLDPAKYGEAFDKFWDDLIRKNIISAIVAGFVEGLSLKTLEPLFEQIQILLARVATGELALKDFGAELTRVLGENKDLIDGMRDSFIAAGQAGQAIVSLFDGSSLGVPDFSGFTSGIRDVLVKAFTEGLDRAKTEAGFDEFFNAFLRTSIAQAVAEGVIQGLALEALKPFFDKLTELMKSVREGALSPQDFGTQLKQALADARPEFDRIRMVLGVTADLVKEVYQGLGIWTDALGSIETQLENINAILDQIEDRKIEIEINFQEKLAAIGLPDALADAIALKLEAATARLEKLLAKPFVTTGTPSSPEDFSTALANIRAAQDAIRDLMNLIVERFNAAKAEIEKRYAAEIDAIRAAGKAAEEAIRAQFRALREASQERVKALQKEKEEIQKTFAARIEALQKELQLAQEFQRVGEQLRDVIIRLMGSQAAPVTPPGQLAFLERQAAALRLQLSTATDEERPDLIRRLAEILEQQLGLGVFQRPSDQYKAQFDAIVAELERLRDEALRVGGTAEDLQKKIVELQEEQTRLLEAIDLKIEAEQKLQDELSKQEQAAIDANTASTAAAIAAAEAAMAAEIQALREKTAEELKALRDQELELNERAKELALTQKSIIEQQLDELKKIEANTRGRSQADPLNTYPLPLPTITAADLQRITAESYGAQAREFGALRGEVTEVGNKVEGTSRRQEAEISTSRTQDVDSWSTFSAQHAAKADETRIAVESITAYGNDVLTPTIQDTNKRLEEIKSMMPVGDRTNELLSSLVEQQNAALAFLATIATNTRLPAPTLAAAGFSGVVNTPSLFLAGEAGQSEHVKITPSHADAPDGKQARAVNVTIAPHVEVTVTITGVERPDEVERKVTTTAARAATLAIEEWARSSRGRKIVGDIAKDEARRISGV